MELTPTWAARINGAESSIELLEIVRAFVRSRPRAVLARIRLHCSCLSIDDPAGLAECATSLDGKTFSDLAEIAAFFVAANRRMGQVPLSEEIAAPIYLCSHR